ncbi:MAG: hypothetical protein J7L47_10045, partial [Candidatus Odinarchaeota archaeon]|nr:hypothetical protein [Candidatus Odinarchaeota archaeon]
MKILVISQDSTSMKKKMKFPPSCEDLLPSKIPIYKALHSEYMNKAINMFVGTQHKKVVRGVNFLKRILGKDSVDFYILSAGFGLIPADEPIIPYSCSFDNMAFQEIIDRSKLLEIPKTLKNILENNEYALVFYILNKNYLLSLNKAPAKTQAVSVFFVDTDIPCKRKVVLSYSNELVSGYFASGIKLGGSVAYKGGLFLAFSKALFSEKDPVGVLQKVSKTVNSFLKYMTASNIAPKLERTKMKLAEIQASEEKEEVSKVPPKLVTMKPSSIPVVSTKVSTSRKKSRESSAKVSVSKPKKEAKAAVKKEKPKKEAKAAVKKEKPKKEAKAAVKK